jgi:DNA-binding MarR family transcriptional regulator
LSWTEIKKLMKCPTAWKSPAQFAVLLVLANATNDKFGYCWPSKRFIARRIGVSPRHVPRVIQELEDLGLIHVRKRAGPRGANTFYLTLTSAVHVTPEQRATSAVHVTPAKHEQVTSETEGDDIESRGDDTERMAPVSCMSPEPIKEPTYVEPKKEPEPGYAVSDEHRARMLSETKARLACVPPLPKRTRGSALLERRPSA